MEIMNDIGTHEAEVGQESCLLETSTEMKSGSGKMFSEVYLKSESSSFDSVFMLQPDPEIPHEIDTKIEIGEDPVWCGRTSTEMTSELEVTLDSDFHIKSEPAGFPSDFLLQANSNADRNAHDVHSKIEIKEEPAFLERMSAEMKSESEEISLKDGNFYFNTQSNTSDGDQEFMLPESIRLEMEEIWSNEYDDTSTGLDMDCLKLKEINSTCHEKVNTDGIDITETFQMDDEITHKRGQYFRRPPSYLKTVMLTHEGKGRHSSVQHEGKRPFKCRICEKSFLRSSHLKVHNFIHEGKRPHKCEVCDKSFSMLSHLKEHNLIHQGKRPHKCEICEKTFTTSSGLKRHNLIHEGRRPHKCDQCDKSFTSTAHLKAHHLIHEGIRPYSCDHCEKSFITSWHLKAHNLIHEGKRPYKCNHCEKSFTSTSHLKEHNLIHEGKRPHKCEVCEKSFTRASHLKVHNLIHEGKRPHKCNRCEKSFTRVSHLKSHILFHEGKRPHKCEICEKCFTLAPDLKRHKLLHSNISPYKCEICEKSFSQASDLNKHVILHEKKNVTLVDQI